MRDTIPCYEMTEHNTKLRLNFVTIFILGVENITAPTISTTNLIQIVIMKTKLLIQKANEMLIRAETVTF